MTDTERVSLNHYLKSAYQRIKKTGCCEWSNPKSFYDWYKDQLKQQKEVCEYCHLLGDTTIHYKKRFRPNKKGTFNRGYNLEVDRKDSKGPYSPKNCVLACYPCNNAKSDVFTYEEFHQIGEIIGKVKGRC